MILGKSYIQKTKTRQEVLKALFEPIQIFAMVPIRLDDGRWAFLQFVYLDMQISKSEFSDLHTRNKLARREYFATRKECLYNINRRRV